jgi:hypothetical protein
MAQPDAGRGGDEIAGEVIELRVHGVSGTPPEALLGLPTELIKAVSGDNAAGFYRPRVTDWEAESADDAGADCGLDIDRHPMDATPEHGPVWKRSVEAYSWGGLTSGPASRALWLLFLPFIFINLAHWMLPPMQSLEEKSASTNTPPRPKSIAAPACVMLLRLIGLSLTLTLMLASAEAAMDVIGWQCASLDYCGRQLGPASFLVNHRDQPGFRLALSAVPVVALVVALWLLGREKAPKMPRVLTSRPDNSKLRRPDAAVAGGALPLANWRFWQHDNSVDRLRACHVTAWASGVGALALVAPVRFGTDAVARVVSTGALVVNLLLFGAAVLAATSNPATGRGGRSAERLSRPLCRLQWWSLLVLLVSLGWVACAPITGVLTPTHLPGLRPASHLLLLVQAVLLLALFVAIARAKAGESVAVPDYGPSLRGYTAAFMATIACLVGTGFSVGVGLLTARLLGSPVPTTSAAAAMVNDREVLLGKDAAAFGDRVTAANEDAPLIVPPLYFFTAAAIVLLLLAAVLAVAVVKWWVVPRHARQALADGLKDYSGDTRARVRDIATARAVAALADGLPAMLAWFTAAAGAAGAVVVVLYLNVDLVNQIGIGAGATKSDRSALAGFVGVSVVVTAGLVAILAAVVFQALRNRRLRRIVGVLWDVVTFWPKANHPLTPPSYGQRAVPQLAADIEREAACENRRVVVAAHSQGTIIAAAALLLAKPPHPLGLLTFGSPLRRLYTKNFPAYFGFAALAGLCTRQQNHWINLWAFSDPIGSWVSDPTNRRLDRALQLVDWRLLDASRVTARPDETYPPICWHSGFWTRCEYQHAFTALQDAVLPGDVAAPAAPNLPAPTQLAT